MTTATLRPDEPQRLQALKRLQILDTTPEPAFDELARTAAQLLRSPMAGLALVDADRIWLKSQFGVKGVVSPREGNPCDAALASEFIATADVSKEGRYASCELVASNNMRYFTAAPVLSAEGLPVGVLFVADRAPRHPSPSERDAIQALARLASALLRARKHEDQPKRAEREERFRLLSDAAFEGMAVLRDGRILEANAKFPEMFGYDGGEVIGMNALDFVSPEYAEVMRGAEIWTDGQPYECQCVRKDGTTFPAEIRGRRVPYQGDSAAVWVFWDLSERKLAEEALRQARERVVMLEEQVQGRDYIPQIVGTSAAMQDVYRRLRMAAQVEVTVLLTGESGTGKELAARAIHDLSARRDKPFYAINCSAVPETLLESELFGHVKGAFTGAVRDKVGAFQAAEGGTLFLDEIGDLSPMIQLKLLRVLQEREIRRVGDEKTIQVDVRVITATNRDLPRRIATGDIREDFYYRIRVFEITLPPLRDRREDIPILAEHFVKQLTANGHKKVEGFTSEAMQRLTETNWQGNARELRNAIEHALVTVQGSRIRLEDLPVEVRTGVVKGGTKPGKVLTVEEEQERRVILGALKKAGGMKTQAARAMGISRVTLWKRMKKLGMEGEDEVNTLTR